jgi:prepilin-type N-terminal cleavage/methylation domain-containing protein
MRQTRIPGRAGFTLLELLGVIVILGILLVFLMPILSNAQKSAKVTSTQIFLQELSAAITEYENEKGDFPVSSWKEEWGTPPNLTNIGCEALVIQLYGTKWETRLSQDQLCNTDEDESKKALARFQKSALFEIKDAWKNPIAYLHRRDYGQAQPYAMTDGGGVPTGESTFRARMNSQTGQYWNPKGFQLVSAGPDCEFGTEDDIPAWKEDH